MRAAVKVVAEKTENGRVNYLALGEDGPPEPLSPQVEIRFVPFVSDLNLIADYYRAADVYIHAARADTFPNAVLESLACGTPVIGSDVGGIPEEVNHEKSGLLVPVGDAAAMAAGIIRLLGDDRLRASMGDHAASDARLRFDLSRQIDAHLDWYGEIVAQGKP
jgi:glycosyltransferase involved in cell wall biosynthesis